MGQGAAGRSMVIIDRRGRMRRRVVFIVVAALVGTGIALAQIGFLGHRNDDIAVFHQRPCAVVGIINADEIRIRTPGGDEAAVKLAGIDAPRGGDYWAIQACDFARNHLPPGKQVIVYLLPPQTRDEGDRLIAYLFPNDAESFNQTLVHEGCAYAERRTQHPFWSLLDEMETDARKHQRGLWKDVTFRQMPAWRQTWLMERRQRSGGVVGGK